MAISNPFLPEEPQADPTLPGDFPEPVRLFEQSMAAIPRTSLLGDPSAVSPMLNTPSTLATNAPLANAPTINADLFTARITPAVVEQQVQTMLAARDDDFAAKQVARQREQNTDMLIVDQLQDSMTGESTRYAPLRESL